MPQTGMKFDGGKRDYTLLPWDALEDVVRVLEFGAQKYARDNWKHVENAEIRYMAAAMRHMVAHLNGEKADPESGIDHLAHAMCCLLFTQSISKKHES